MNEQEILLPIVGIHLFLGIALIFISILLFVFLRKPQVFLVIASLLLLTFSHFYYYLYYTGSLVHFPNIIFIFPMVIVIGSPMTLFWTHFYAIFNSNSSGLT